MLAPIVLGAILLLASVSFIGIGYGMIKDKLIWLGVFMSTAGGFFLGLLAWFLSTERIF